MGFYDDNHNLDETMLKIIADKLTFHSNYFCQSTVANGEGCVSESQLVAAIGELKSIDMTGYAVSSVISLLGLEVVIANKHKEQNTQVLEIFELVISNHDDSEYHYFILSEEGCLPLKNKDNLILNMPAAVALIQELMEQKLQSFYQGEESLYAQSSSLYISLPANHLRIIVINTLLDAVGEILALSDQGQHRLSLIVRELFSNALEHGLLDLSSKDKCSVEGFENYYKARAMKLEALKEGAIFMQIDHSPVQKSCSLTLSHNGQGFDYNEIKQRQQLDDCECLHGRGLKLIAMHATSLSFDNHGCNVYVQIET